MSTKKNEKACYLAEQSLPDVHRFSLVWLSPRQGLWLEFWHGNFLSHIMNPPNIVLIVADNLG
ncbi:hypothetical protein, partial [Delftia acidovorans]|uniref:hypothetical protein n=1 Tax=Delftia acidovorans TaxID=80866 RepID=UPI00359F2C37